ncbi:MAG: hypothetical protein CL912_12345 [Deltaproteobacteria bacterium]|nr:hypothetical protein [Deltaproteobacteria bacterium]|tara:strand:+ start:679 stop:951 length:273 start_codon:yes stop_codon:yes gene_type:complete
MGDEKFPVTKKKKMLNDVKYMFLEERLAGDRRIRSLFPGIPQQECCLLPNSERIIIDFHEGANGSERKLIDRSDGLALQWDAEKHSWKWI